MLVIIEGPDGTELLLNTDDVSVVSKDPDGVVRMHFRSQRGALPLQFDSPAEFMSALQESLCESDLFLDTAEPTRNDLCECADRIVSAVRGQCETYGCPHPAPGAPGLCTACEERRAARREEARRRREAAKKGGCG